MPRPPRLRPPGFGGVDRIPETHIDLHPDHGTRQRCPELDPNTGILLLCPNRIRENRVHVELHSVVGYFDSADAVEHLSDRGTVYPPISQMTRIPDPGLNNPASPSLHGRPFLRPPSILSETTALIAETSGPIRYHYPCVWKCG